MKIIYCTCNVSVIEMLQQNIEELGVKNYQLFEQVLAKNIKGDNRLNTAVWPGYNSAIMMQIESVELAHLVMKRIKEINSTAFNHNELIVACMWTLEDFIYE
jgi:hypothetical protein